MLRDWKNAATWRFLFVGAIGISSLAVNQTAHADLVSDLAACTSINETDKRLSCFDRAVAASPAVDVAKRPKKADEKSPTIAAPSGGVQPIKQTDFDRRAYVARLEHAFLEAGINMDVFISTKGTKGYTKDVVPPSLTFFGYIDKVVIYKIVTKINVLEEARRLEFKTVEFSDKGNNGRWIFLLSGSGQICDRDLCF